MAGGKGPNIRPKTTPLLQEEVDDGGSSEDEGVGEVELDDGEDACSLVTLLRAYPSAEGAELSKVRRYLQTAVAHYSAGAWKNCVLWLDAALELETGEARLAFSLRVFKQIPRAKTALALPRPTAARAAALALPRHHC